MGGGEGREEGRGSPKSVSLRERWKRAIEQQIMLQRMEKENQSLMSKTPVYTTFAHPKCGWFAKLFPYIYSPA